MGEETRPTLEQFADIIGEEAAVRLTVRFGGLRLYVPKEPTGELVQLIGLKAAQLLSHRFGGVHFEMPLERGKRERILHMSKAGYSVQEIAAKVGCTGRHVYAVRRQARENGVEGFDLTPKGNPDQTDLFGDSSLPTPSTSTED